VAVLGAGIHAPRAEPDNLEPPPRLGEHTAAVIEWLEREGASGNARQRLEQERREQVSTDQ
jgi:hypothetical protein